MTEEKECFFIAPIGEEDSEIRDRSDTVLEYIVEKAVSEYGYSVTRADQMDQPGSITDQIIERTINSDLVIADLTDHNPNVFYELAVRHATGEPYIQLINGAESIPFDLNDIRTINYGLGVEEAEQAAAEIASHLESLEEGDTEIDNPISKSAEMASLRQSPDPSDQNLAEILDKISSLDKKIEQLDRRTDSSLQPYDAENWISKDKTPVEIGGMKAELEEPVSPDDIDLLEGWIDMSAPEIRKQLLKQGIEIKDVMQD